MKINIEINQDSTAHELRALAAFFAVLGGDDIHDIVGKVPPIALALGGNIGVPDLGNVQTQQTQEAETKTRRTRRTKAEIDAEAGVTQTTEAAQPPEQPAAEVIDKTTGEITQMVTTDNGTAVPPEEFETAAAPAAATGKTYGEAEVQQLATVVARVKGPQVVKEKIASLGAPRIAALTAEQLNILGAYLETQK